ncbi:hypothetical protein L218DRAFT_758195 [Marasmius fiardii PR-910]|nr:hypothetical protein L218DRAFT_758195 [Marasmius fiardii PR-910]
MYTYLQKSTGSQSRIDRIYAKQPLMEDTFEWSIKAVGIPTDHRLVTVKITNENSPDVGKGRWAWPLHLYSDKILNEFICHEGIELSGKIDSLKRSETERSEHHNVQTLWEKFKTTVTSKVRERAKIAIPRLDKQIREIETRINMITRDRLIEEEERALALAVYTEKLIDLESKRHCSKRESARATNALKGEVIGRYWSKINKPSRPRDIIKRLNVCENHANDDEANLDTPRYEKRSQHMANMARKLPQQNSIQRPENITQRPGTQRTSNS